MIYRLLGDLEIGRPDRALDLPGGATLNLLAALVINANRQLSAADLIRAGWGGDSVQTAQLYKRISTVRDLLTQLGRRDDLRTHSGSGYELRTRAEDVDALLFQRLVREAARAEAERRTEQEVRALRSALRLWRGPHPLSNVPASVFQHETAALERRRKRAAARLFDLELARGSDEGILDELILMTAAYPSDQRLCEQLMLAAYRCGHVTDVAAAYERHREAIAGETGADPDPVLRDFHFAVARGDGTASEAVEALVARRAGAALRRAVPVPQQLPRPVDLVGRDQPVAEVSRLLRQEPRASPAVVVISGPGGIGKTALALRAAHEVKDDYPDGELYAELGGIRLGCADLDDLLGQFLRAFDVPQVPETTAERLSAYRTLLAGRRVLIVLDDAASGAQAGELVPASPGCAVIITSRQRLPDISGAVHLAPLEPLPHQDAADLFLRTVTGSGIRLDKELEDADRVVALCGGLPLALCIAGALRVHDDPRPAGELAERLASQGPDAFRYGDLSVARTIGAGLDHLDAAGRQLFLGLGMLPLASFGLWTATALLGGTSAAGASALSQLAARFLAEPLVSEVRYRFHELTSEYARHRALAEYPGDRDAIPGRVYSALLTLTRRAHRGLYGGDFEVVHSDVPGWDAPPEVLAEVDSAPLAWFEKERRNIRAAVEHCAALGLTGICWDLAVSAHEFYTIAGHFDDWHATHRLALAACRKAGDQRGEGIVLACLSQPTIVAGRLVSSAAALANLQRAAALLADCGDRHGQAIALRTLANALRRHGHLTQPLALFHDALGHYRAVGDTVGWWQTLRFIGQTCLELGALGEAVGKLEEARSLAEQLGGSRLIAQTQYWLGQAYLAIGELDAAERMFGTVLAVYPDEAGVGHAYAAHGLGDLARHRHEYETAGQRFAVAAGLAREAADAVLGGRVRLSQAAMYRDQGLPDEQAVALEHAAVIFTRCGAAYLEMQALAALAEVTAARGDRAAAAAAWARIGSLYRGAGVPTEDRIYGRPSRLNSTSRS